MLRSGPTLIGQGRVRHSLALFVPKFFDPPDIDGRMPRVSKWER
jgi:hypothetical protein